MGARDRQCILRHGGPAGRGSPVGSPLSAFADVRKALLVAASTYEDPNVAKLRAVAEDVEDLSHVLADPEVGPFDVETSTNEPHYAVRKRISAFFKGAGRKDLLLVHVSSHGLKDDYGNLYFATADTELGLLEATTVSADFVNEEMRKSRARRILLLLDCCFSGAFESGMDKKGDDAVHLGDHFKGKGTGRVVLTASDDMEYSFVGKNLTGEGRASVFTRAVVQGLKTGEADRDRDSFISAAELYDYVSRIVAEERPEQTPKLWTYEQEGSLIVARSRFKPSASPTYSPLPEAIVSAARSPVALLREGVAPDLATFLRSGDPDQAQAARELLATLAEDPVPRVADAASKALRPQRRRPWERFRRRTLVLWASPLGALGLGLVLWLVIPGPGPTPVPPAPVLQWTRAASGDDFEGPGHQEVNALAAAGDGTAVAVGYSAQARRQHRARVWRLDGSRWSWDTSLPSDTYALTWATAARGPTAIVGGATGGDVSVTSAAVWVSEAGGPWQLRCPGKAESSCVASSGGRNAVRALLAGPSGFVAVGRDEAESFSGFRPAVWTSVDARIWERTLLGSAFGEVNAVTRAAGRLVAVGVMDSHAAVWRYDGERWTRTDLDADQLDAVAARGATVVAAGSRGRACPDRRTVVFRSADAGATWERAPGPESPSESQWRGIVAFGGGFVALGSRHDDCGAPDGAAWTSADGVTWTWGPVPGGQGSALFGGAVVGDVLFAGGSRPSRLETQSTASDERDADIWAASNAVTSGGG